MIQENVVLKPYTNYKIGGKADYFIEATSEEELCEAVLWAKKKHLPFFLLGGGTNIIVSDKGFQGVVIHNRFTDIHVTGVHAFFGSGAPVQGVVDILIDRGLTGMEWAGGLPGSIGGAIHGNAGAFGGYISQCLVEVRALSPSGHVYTISKQECGFQYRTSIFKEEDGWVILGAFFEFQTGDKSVLQKKVDELREWRRVRHPLEYGNCGSVFKRIAVDDLPVHLMSQHPDITSAIRDNQVAIAYFIDQCGLKERSIGGAKISEKHPNFFVNATGDAQAQDILMLINVAKHSVMKRYGICLEEEVEMIGFENPLYYQRDF
ncbi:MAG: UDP-N-acetylmuramate dehydrogenase [Candidatus Spechtbacteria bacterium SB0662_bin_43]|uniref:UDP-N-acetylenolpyruvoylglucosamine reductase n=1 Tax=Candidatus Spechtbacteria bacterium SB0662_bin_43 TaxID=2604897 RepID=A0A845DL26_9BACT|nr:UDP-N-acetylmuramate dehydrogenase [Candidatus Spechtbacteria bacterium SB0662_bin_43]